MFVKPGPAPGIMRGGEGGGGGGAVSLASRPLSSTAPALATLGMPLSFNARPLSQQAVPVPCSSPAGPRQGHRPHEAAPLDLSVSVQGGDQPLDLSTKPAKRPKPPQEEDDVIVVGVHKPAKCSRNDEKHTHVTMRAHMHANAQSKVESQGSVPLLPGSYSSAYSQLHHHQLQQQRLASSSLPNFAMINKDLMDASRQAALGGSRASHRAALFHQALLQQQQQRAMTPSPHHLASLSPSAQSARSPSSRAPEVLQSRGATRPTPPPASPGSQSRPPSLPRTPVGYSSASGSPLSRPGTPKYSPLMSPGGFTYNGQRPHSVTPDWGSKGYPSHPARGEHHNMPHHGPGTRVHIQATVTGVATSLAARGGSQTVPEPGPSIERPTLGRNSVQSPMYSNTARQSVISPANRPSNHMPGMPSPAQRPSSPPRNPYTYPQGHIVRPPPYPGHSVTSYSKQGVPCEGSTRGGQGQSVCSRETRPHSASSSMGDPQVTQGKLGSSLADSSPQRYNSVAGNMAIHRVQENQKAFRAMPTSPSPGHRPKTQSTHMPANPPLCPSGGGSISRGVPIMGPLPPQYGPRNSNHRPAVPAGMGYGHPPSQDLPQHSHPHPHTEKNAQHTPQYVPPPPPSVKQETAPSCTQNCDVSRPDVKPKLGREPGCIPPHSSVSGPFSVPPPAYIPHEGRAQQITIQPRSQTGAVMQALPQGIRLTRTGPDISAKCDRPLGQKKIPVANVNPIIHSQSKTLQALHPKKQMLYQSQMENQATGEETHSNCASPCVNGDSDAKESSLRSMLEGKEYVRETLPVSTKPRANGGAIRDLIHDALKVAYRVDRGEGKKDRSDILEAHLKEVAPIAKVPPCPNEAVALTENAGRVVSPIKTSTKPDIMQPVKEKLKLKCAQRQALQEAAARQKLKMAGDFKDQYEPKVKCPNTASSIIVKSDTKPKVPSTGGKSKAQPSRPKAAVPKTEGSGKGSGKRGPERKKKTMAPLRWKMLQAYRHDRGLQGYRHRKNSSTVPPSSAGSAGSHPYSRVKQEGANAGMATGPHQSLDMSPGCSKMETWTEGRTEHGSIYDFDSSPTVCLTDISKMHKRSKPIKQMAIEFFSDDETETESTPPKPEIKEIKKKKKIARGKPKTAVPAKDAADKENQGALDRKSKVSRDLVMAPGKERKMNKKGLPVRRYRRRHKATGWDYERQNARKRQQYAEARQNNQHGGNGRSTGSSRACTKTRTRATTRGNRRTPTYNKNAAYERELRRDEYRKLLLRYKREARPLRAATRRHESRRTSKRLAKRARELQQEQDDKEATNKPKKERKEGYESEADSGEGQAEGSYPAKRCRKRRHSHFGTNKGTLAKALRKHRRNKENKKPHKHVVLAHMRRMPRPYEEEFGVQENQVLVPYDDPLIGGSVDLLPVGSGVAPEMVPPPDVKRLVVLKETGETMLHKAARLGNEEVTLYCLHTKCVEVNARDHAGYTPLHEGCVKGHLAVVRHLVGCGADVNASALDGTRPIHDAVDNNHVEVVRLLLACGADMGLATYSGRTAMKLARTPDMRAFLLGYMADLNGPAEAQAPWEFPARFTEKDPDQLGQDLFDDVPCDPDGEEDVLFDISDEPLLPTYFLSAAEHKGPRNYHVLEDVLSTLELTRDELAQQLDRPTFLQIPRQQFDTQVSCSQVARTRTKELPPGPEVHLIAVTDALNELLGVETVILNINSCEEDQEVVCPEPNSPGFNMGDITDLDDVSRLEDDVSLDLKENKGASKCAAPAPMAIPKDDIWGGYADCDSRENKFLPTRNACCSRPRVNAQECLQNSFNKCTNDVHAAVKCRMDNGGSTEELSKMVASPMTLTPAERRLGVTRASFSQSQKQHCEGQGEGQGRTGVSQGQLSHKTFPSQEFKVAATPEDCFVELARKRAERRRSTCEERSISPKAAQGAETTAMVPSVGMTQSKREVLLGVDPPSSSEGEPFDALPVLEKHENAEDSDDTDMNEDIAEDREMPQLTIAAY